MKHLEITKVCLTKRSVFKLCRRRTLYANDLSFVARIQVSWKLNVTGAKSSLEFIQCYKTIHFRGFFRTNLLNLVSPLLE